MDSSDDEPLLSAVPATRRGAYAHFGAVHNRWNQATGRALAAPCCSGARLSEASDGGAVHAKPYINLEATW
jgi:hypothetical protein